MQPYTKLLTSSAYTSTLSLAAVTGLSANVVAGGVYLFRSFLTYTPGATSLIGCTMGGSCTATQVAYRVAIQRDSTPNTSTQAQAAIPGTAPSPGALAAGTWAITIDGFIKVNAAGTLEVQVKHTTASFTVTAGSVLVLDQIA